MGVFTFTNTFTSQISPERLFKAHVLDGHNLLPKLVPQVIKSIELAQGNGGPGTIKTINITEGSKSIYVKQMVDIVDNENLTHSYTVTEGNDDLMQKIESICFGVKFERSAEGGSKGTEVCKVTTKEGVDLNEEEIKASMGKAVGLYKAIEEYLVANPQAYA